MKGLWKRGVLEIMAQILSSLLDNPQKKSRIILKCNLDSRTLTKYLILMDSFELIKKSPKNRSLIIITQKGMEFLKKYESLIEVINLDIKNFKKSNLSKKTKFQIS